MPLVTTRVDALVEQLRRLANYFGAELEPEVLRLYVDALKHVPDSALTAACRHLIQTATFMPKVAEILTAVNQALAPQASDVRAAFDSYVCTRCEDNGWVFVADHAVKRCSCYLTNPRLRR